MLTATQRTALLSLAVHLEPGADPDPLLSVVRAHRDACLAELAEQPGIDQVRAVLVRALPDEVEGHRAAAQALAAFPDQVTEIGRSLLLRRHPAWVGLCRLELAGGPDSANSAEIDDAIRLCNAGFSAAADASELGDGEALWAMAEQAETVQWTDRYATLLTLAAAAEFADSAHVAQVRLLLGLHRADQPDADALFEAVAIDEAAPIPTRVHAAWILAHRTDDTGRWLSSALEWLDEDDDPDVRARIERALAQV